MKKRKRLILILALIVATGLFSACGNKGDESLPNAAITQAYETAMAALTQTAQAEPSATFTYTPTFEPSATFTAPAPLASNTPFPTQAPPSSGPALSSCDLASFVSDVTIPDGTELAPGQVFTKTWRIRNEGTCTWTDKYQILYFGGEIMSEKTAYALTSVEIAPGNPLDISIEMTAPTTPGSYTMWWIMRNADGLNFGIDQYGGAIYVQISVSSSAASFTATPTSTSAATVVATTEAPTETATETPTDTTTPADTTTP